MNNSYLQTGTIILTILYVFQSFSITSYSVFRLNKLLYIGIRLTVMFIPLIIFEFFPDDIFILLIIHLSYLPMVHLIKLIFLKLFKIKFKYLGYLNELSMILILAILFTFSFFFTDYSLGGVLNKSLSTFRYFIISDFNVSW